MPCWSDHLSNESRSLLTPCSYDNQDKNNGEPGKSGWQLCDEDFESAINSLEASTAAIEKQCKLLEAQKQALQEIQARNATAHQSEDSQRQHFNKLTREKAQAELKTAELAKTLHSRVERSLKQAESSTDNIQPTADRTLERDDRLLDGLEKVLPQLSLPNGNPEHADEVGSLCQALITHSNAEIHSRIDATYSAAVQTHGSQANGIHVQEAESQRASLRAELEELCREIDGLSSMAVDTQYRIPISKALQAASSDSDGERAMCSEYLGSTLQYLTARLEAMDDQTQQVRAHSAAVKTMARVLEIVLAIAVDKKQLSQQNSQSPTKLSQRGLKPLRLVQANLSESHDPATQLLRHLDIRTSESDDSMRLSELIGAAVIEKNGKLLSLSASSEQRITDQVVQSLDITESSLQTLLSVVYAYSPFKTVSLVQNDLTEGIDRLEQKTRTMGEQMRDLDADKITRTMREAQQTLLK